MNRKRWWWASVGVPLWLLGAPGHAQAEPSRTEQADQLFREGREAVKRQDYLGACNKFRASQKLDPAPGTTLSIAECEEALERPAVAHRYYREVLEKLPATDERAVLARKQRAALESRLGRVEMGNIPSKYSYQIELYADSTHETLVPTSPADPHGVWVAPGTYHLALFVEGKELQIPGEVQVRAGEQKRVEYRPPGGQAQAPAPSPMPREASKGLRTGTKVALVGSGVGLLGGILWLHGVRERDSALALCPSTQSLECREYERANDRLAESRTWRVTGQVLVGTGAVALVVGLLMNAKSDSRKKQTVHFRPWADPSIGLSGAAVGGTW